MKNPFLQVFKEPYSWEFQSLWKFFHFPSAFYKFQDQLTSNIHLHKPSHFQALSLCKQDFFDEVII